MALKDDLEARVDELLTVTWDVRDGQVVPEDTDVVLKDGGVNLKAVYLYADLADSTVLARDFNRRTAARVIRSYLAVMSRLITHHGGAIRSFDGDRVMGIFVGSSKNTSAAKCGLRMHWAFLNIVRPRVEAKFPKLKEGGYTLEHTAGIDFGDVFIVRAGIRGSNDLISIGRPPNIAAALSDRRYAPYRTYMTKDVYDNLHESAKYSAGGENMWRAVKATIKSRDMTLYRSNWWVAP